MTFSEGEEECVAVGGGGVLGEGERVWRGDLWMGGGRGE